MTIRPRNWALTAVALLATIASFSASAAELRVLAANGVSRPATELLPEFTAATGDTVRFTFESPGGVNNRLAAGETYDLVILPTEAARVREAAGDFKPGTRKALARLGIGVAARRGRVLDLSTVESTRRALLAARSIVLSDGATGGLSRPNAEKVLANLGIFDEVKTTLVYAREGQGLIASGDAELGLFNVSEIGRANGVILAGPVPASVQVYITYDAAVPRANAAPERVLALVAFLSRPETRAVWEKSGLALAAGE